MRQITSRRAVTIIDGREVPDHQVVRDVPSPEPRVWGSEQAKPGPDKKLKSADRETPGSKGSEE